MTSADRLFWHGSGTWIMPVSAQRERSDADTSRGESRDRAALKVLFENLEISQDDVGQVGWTKLYQLSHEDYGGFGRASVGQECAEVGVSGDDGPTVRDGEFHDRGVGRARCLEIAYMDRVVTSFGQQLGNAG